MDPKMDSGLMPAISEEQFNVLASRSPEEIIGVMDQLLSSEMAWHTGSSLSQTVLISLYIDSLLENSPHVLEQAVFRSPPPELSQHDEVLLSVLRAYCLGLVKCCGVVNTRIKSQYLPEEEDFSTSTYNISLLDSINPRDVCEELEKTLQLLETVADAGLWRENIHSALKDRLSHRLAMLQGFSLDLEQYHSYKDIASPPWESCIKLCTQIEESHNLGKPVEEAFSTNVQRKLASTVPPRPKVDMPFAEAIGNLKRMCQEMMEIMKVLEYVSPGNIVTFLLRFNSRKQQPFTYVRVSLQALLVQNWVVVGKIPIKEYVIEDVKELCCPLPKLLDSRNSAAEHPLSAESNITKRINWFVDRAMQLILGLFQKLCMNRPRLRRTLCHTLLEWDTFQAEAEEVDAELREYTKEEPMAGVDGGETFSYPLSSWVFHYKLRIMEWIVLLGFELEIYQPYEFAGMYWVVQHYISSRILHIDRIRSHLLHQATKPVPEEWTAQQQDTLAYLTYLSIEAKAQHDLVAALLNTHRLLLAMDLIKTHPQPYGTGELRFMLRMKPFKSIQVPENFDWESVPWEYFQPQKEKEADAENGVDEERIAADKQETLEEATYYITEARRHYELLNKMRASVSRSLLCEEMYKNVG
ncbi:hypothetical protein L211DRAFT_805150 [Terfezia boudieri ATCC MYA-4762]|uniref:Mak10-domain-containing protein n=1 Tax=Terfezia boudieri ATCC MYA-4762 TaxID=1051890 RepID=A0A3N4LTU6_9PEZI|nr:hypothetical protein L211DRAFT_805150 [Terfezia boudieri ATCC MYA-4762]